MSNYIDYTVRVYPNGTRKWWFEGKLHREGGPAIEWSDGVKEWWFKGKRHREGGPAVVYPDNIKKWFLHGVQVTEEDLIGKSLVGKTVTIDNVEYVLS